MKPNDASEYYGSILGATIYKKGEQQNSQYVPEAAHENGLIFCLCEKSRSDEPVKHPT